MGTRAGLASADFAARRRLLGLALATAVPGAWSRGSFGAPARALQADPFPLGVASGPGTPGGVVLWTRVAPAIDGLIERFSRLGTEEYVAARTAYGANDAAPGVRYDVRWEMAQDDAFRTIVRRGTAAAVPELAHAVHVEVAGLAPGQWYWYRFLLGDAVSPVGRTRVAPADAPARLRFALASCQHYEYGHFGAYAQMRADDPDTVIFVGDYIYEGGPSEKRFRPHPFPAARHLFDYRLRHALYKRDPHLQRMHAHCPWLLTWDDHEVSNDYAGDSGENPAIDGAARRAAAYQAYYEHMPLPATALLQRFAHLRLYRQVPFGALANVVLLDDRQYRDRQACQPSGRGGSSDVEEKACPQRLDPARTLLGAEQMAWLARSFATSGARWNFIAQQTLFAPLVREDDGKRRFWTDGWEGYPAERERVLAALTAARLRNPVFLGGDVHANWVADIHRDAAGEAPVATEFCGTSITSASHVSAERIARTARANPHVRLADNQRRGYAMAEVTPRELRVDLRVADDVRQAQPTVSTLASFVVADGRPGANREP